MRLSSRRPSPALVVACVSLAVALSGTGYAAIVLPKGSVGTAHLKQNAVTSAKVRNGTLRLADFARAERRRLVGAKGDTGAPGPKGDKGDRGDRGEIGPAGPAGLSDVEVVRAETTAQSSTFQTITATCPSGKRPVAGGAAVSSSLIAPISITRSEVSTPSPTGWTASAWETSPTTANWYVRAIAVCVRTS